MTRADGHAMCTWIARRLLLACAVCGATGGARPIAGAAEETPWEIKPYRVRVTLAIDAGLRPDAALEATLQRHLVERTVAALRPVWVFEFDQATTVADRALCLDRRPEPPSKPPRNPGGVDKLVWLGVRTTSTGFVVTCREFDSYTRRWGPLVERSIPQRTYLAEGAFRALAASIRPVARIESGGGEGQVQLVMRGAALPTPQGAAMITAPGDAFVPLFRRTSRGGALADDGVAPLPWTYLVAVEPNRKGWIASVETALGNPFAGRRRAGVEHVAIALGEARMEAKVRFFARSNPDEGLAGYEVFRVPQDGEPQRLGVTDRDGVFIVPATARPIATLLLRSDGQVLAKLVVAAGSGEAIAAPIADDAVRLTAQGEAQAVREELVDIVARRTILIARVKALLTKGEADKARELMDVLNELPTPGEFARRIDAVRNRLPESPDPRVRQTVEGLFTSTRELLTQFLDARVITDLQAEVNAASRGGS